jgi:uncharacterized protein YbjQ (UPF0145 family)
MWNCKKCDEGNEDNFDVCWNCSSDDNELVYIPEEEKANLIKLKKIILTTETNLNMKIEQRLGILSSECVIGMNIFSDFFTSIRDVIGGRSKTFQNTLKEAKENVLSELKQQAVDLGSNAVIAINLDYSEISGGGKSMLFVVATGTAVIIAKDNELQKSTLHNKS